MQKHIKKGDEKEKEKKNTPQMKMPAANNYDIIKSCESGRKDSNAPRTLS